MVRKLLTMVGCVAIGVVLVLGLQYFQSTNVAHPEEKVRDPETGKRVNDYTALRVAENMVIRNIPERAQEYVVNGKSALGWLVDRYQVKTDPKSGIVNDPNSYSRKPRYIVDLVESVVRVSMETLDVVEALPPLDELPQAANWPIEWRA